MPLQIFHRCDPSLFSSPEAPVFGRRPMLRLCRTISPRVQSELQRRGRCLVAHVAAAAPLARELLHYDKVAAGRNGNRNAR